MNAGRKSDIGIVPEKRANNLGVSQCGAGGGKANDQRKSESERAVPDSGLGKWFISTEPDRRSGDFASDRREEPYEVIPHVRICAGGAG
jgi:hypothetical protein